jgi:hypothetical protein
MHSYEQPRGTRRAAGRPGIVVPGFPSVFAPMDLQSVLVNMW